MSVYKKYVRILTERVLTEKSVVWGVIVVVVVIIVGIVVCASGNFRNQINKSAGYSWANRVTIDPTKPYVVTDVIDGDTIKSYIDGHEITIRLLGIDTPEVVDPRKPVQCYGPEASQETKLLLAGANMSSSSYVYISLNPAYERIDKYGRLLAYIHRASDDLFVNEFLIKEGYAREYTFNEKNPYQYQSLFKTDQAMAQKSGKGLWAKCQLSSLSV